MSITSGFFDSQNHDRAYNATQFGSIFDGVITDGVYSTIGTQFQVKAAGGLVLNVGIGRAWFDHSWILNDTIYVITAPASHPLYNRIDAVVLDIDTTDAVRSNTIKYITGTAASSPANPELISETGHHQHPLAYILRSANSSSIVQASITNMVGTSACPFVAGVAGTVDIDDLLAQWDDEFGTWFEGIKGQLSTDVAGNLQNQIDSLKAQVHPIGSYYISHESTSPASLFGGTWTQITDQFIYAAGTKSAGATGGEETHTLTESELAKHRHIVLARRDDSGSDYSGTGADCSYWYYATTSIGYVNNHSAYAGGGAAHNNMPPYIVAYIWRRTA